MSEKTLCTLPTSTTKEAARTTGFPSPGAISRQSPAERMPHSPHIALPSTSATPLFGAHSLMSPPAIQAIANTLLSQSPLFNPAFNPLAAFASPPDLARVQQWFQQHNSPYTSPSQSSTPSLISNLSELSILSGDSSFTLNSQQLNNKFGKTDEFLDPKRDQQKFIECFLETVRNTDQEMFIRSLKPLKMFADAIVKQKIPMEFDQKNFRELIKTLIDQLTIPKEQRLINAILDILFILINQQQFEMVIRERKTPVLNIFVHHFYRIADSIIKNKEDQHQLKALRSILWIIHRCLSLVKDKQSIRTESFFDKILSLMRKNGNSTIKFIALGILRCLIHGEERWKQYVFDQQIVEFVMSLMNKSDNRRIFFQSLRFLNTLLDSADGRFAATFVKNAGIDILMHKITTLEVLSAKEDNQQDNLVRPLTCLKLVSDTLATANQDLSLAINLCLMATFPPREPRTSVYWTNILNALGFLRNAAVLNKQARDYLTTLEGGRAVQHFGDLARQCLHVVSTEGETDKVSRLKQALSMLDDTLVILAAFSKEMPDGTLTAGQKNAAKLIANNQTILLIYQYILRMDPTSTAKYQKSVLLSLNRIGKAGAIPPASNHQDPQLAETLLNFLFSRFDSKDDGKLLLLKMCAEVLYKLIVAPDRRHIDVITPLMSGGVFQPFDLLHSITNNSNNMDSDLYLAVLKIINELCKREPTLKSQWSANIANVSFLESNSAMSSNSQIADFCKEVLDMLHMGEDSSICDFYPLFGNN